LFQRQSDCQRGARRVHSSSALYSAWRICSRTCSTSGTLGESGKQGRSLQIPTQQHSDTATQQKSLNAVVLVKSRVRGAEAATEGSVIANQQHCTGPTHHVVRSQQVAPNSFPTPACVCFARDSAVINHLPVRRRGDCLGVSVASICNPVRARGERFPCTKNPATPASLRDRIRPRPDAWRVASAHNDGCTSAARHYGCHGGHSRCRRIVAAPLYQR
jgi:hypothetical protein